MLIREATIADAPLLAPLFEAWDHPLPVGEIGKIIDDWLAAPSSRMLVAENSAALVGFVAVTARPGLSNARPVAHLSGLVVDANLRRTGVGRALLDAAERLAQVWGCSRVELSSSLSRDAAHRFYPDAGYEDSTMHHAFYAKRLADPGSPAD